MADLLVAEGVAFGQVVQDARHDAAGAAGRGRDDRAAGSVFLGNGQSIGEYEATGTEVGLVAHGLDMIGRCLARQVQRTGQTAVRVQAALDGGLHRLPDFLEIVPDFRALVHIDILPEAPAGSVAPLGDFREGVHLIYIPRSRHFPARSFGQGTAAYAEDGPFVHDVGFPVDGFEQHAVGVVIEDGLRLPDHPDGRDRLQRVDNGDIGHMPLACRGKRAIEGNFEAVGVRMLFGKHRGGLVRAHGVGRGGSSPDLVEFFERFHPRSFYWGRKDTKYSGHFVQQALN